VALTGEEIRARLSVFAARWSVYEGSERSEAQTFLNELFECYGTRRSDEARFEEPQAGRFLDLIWPRVCVIEMKAPSEAKRLDKHRPQAFDYWRDAADPAKGVPAPRYVVICAFRKLEIWEPGPFPHEPRVVLVGRRATGIGDLLLGMNAHISRDLPFAVASIGFRPGGGGASEERAFGQVNQLLTAVQDSILREESRRFDPTIGTFTLPVLKVDAASVALLIDKWRDAALRDGLRLLRARTSAHRAAVVQSIEDNATARAAIIFAATSRVPFSKAGKARDRHGIIGRSPPCACRPCSAPTYCRAARSGRARGERAAHGGIRARRARACRRSRT